jgi:hypothetical protein
LNILSDAGSSAAALQWRLVPSAHANHSAGIRSGFFSPKGLPEFTSALRHWEPDGEPEVPDALWCGQPKGSRLNLVFYAGDHGRLSPPAGAGAIVKHANVIATYLGMPSRDNEESRGLLSSARRKWIETRAGKLYDFFPQKNRYTKPLGAFAADKEQDTFAASGSIQKDLTTVRAKQWEGMASQPMPELNALLEEVKKVLAPVTSSDAGRTILSRSIPFTVWGWQTVWVLFALSITWILWMQQYGLPGSRGVLIPMLTAFCFGFLGLGAAKACCALLQPYVWPYGATMPQSVAPATVSVSVTFLTTSLYLLLLLLQSWFRARVRHSAYAVMIRRPSAFDTHRNRRWKRVFADCIIFMLRVFSLGLIGAAAAWWTAAPVAKSGSPFWIPAAYGTSVLAGGTLLLAAIALTLFGLLLYTRRYTPKGG